MAVRKTTTRKTTKRRAPSKPAPKGKRNRVPTSAAFWTFLIIVIIIAFFMLLPVIKRGLTIGPKTAEPEQQQEQGTGNREQGAGEDERKAREEGKGKKEQVTEEKKPQAEKPATPQQTSPPKTPVKEPEKTPNAKPPDQPEKKPQTEKPATPAQPSSPQPSPPEVKPAETRDRSIYLIQESAMAQVKVNRKLNVSDTPLKDSIVALLAGPTADERRRGMISLVPEGSSLLSVRVEGTTAVLDFNQEFRYNTRGSEGCAAQIKQIVWTATEFSNVKDVQFLIDGQRVDFLSEGVVIKNPIGR